MQKENIPFNNPSSSDKSSAATTAPPPLIFPPFNPFVSRPTSPSYMNNSASFYSSLFQNYSPNYPPSETSSFDGGGDTESRLNDASGILEYQQLYNRYTLCLTQLYDSIEEVDALRRENDSLHLSNADLSHRVALLFSRDRLLSEFNRLNISGPRSACAAAAPQPLAEQNREDTDRVTLPKIISVRSSGYLKMNRAGCETTRSKTVSQPGSASQRVCVPPGVKKEEEAMEFEVYNQGMSKTELCNKWQETGACPYGENCQFAHGIKELRPVIRHPRYKTEVCRMVLAGGSCPYGYRCHFRHTLTGEERMMALPPSLFRTS